MKGLTEGRIVHYVLHDGPSKGEHRPAIIVRVWDQDTGMANLQVFLDGGNDDPLGRANVVWITSIRNDEDKPQGTWHWIESA